MTHAQTPEQQQERISRQLQSVITRLQQEIEAPADILMKRIEADAATIAVLALVAELLPEPICEQIRTIVTLHEKTWKIDLPTEEGATPRKPLANALLDQVTRDLNCGEA
jgi:hypothetical protein